MKWLLILIMAFTLVSCDDEASQDNCAVVIEAPDYQPLGEGIKVLAISLIAVALIRGIAKIVGKGGQ